MPAPTEQHHLPVICRCGDRAPAGDARYRRVMAQLAEGSTELRPRVVTDRSMLEDLLLSLLVDHSATVASSHGKLWWAGTADAGPLGQQVRVVVQCDQVIPGLCAVWQWLVAKLIQVSLPDSAVTFLGKLTLIAELGDQFGNRGSLARPPMGTAQVSRFTPRKDPRAAPPTGPAG